MTRAGADAVRRPLTGARAAPAQGLSVEGLVVRFGHRAAVGGVDLAVAEGEVVCLLGPSGCGKTTLLRAVAGLVEPSAGRITWDGEDLDGVPPHRRRMGLVFQDYALFPHIDVAGNVGFGLRMQGRRAAEVASRTAEVLELVGLGGQGGRAVGGLSGGEQQRVALARALAPEPRLLLLDEPLAALDRGLRARLLGDLAELLDRLGATAVHVTHDQEEAFALGDRVAVMEAGRMVQVDTPAGLWAAPGSASVARFLGFTVLAGTVAGGWATGPWGSLPAPRAGAGRCHVVLRPEALSLDAAGLLSGRVTTATFRGDRVVVTVSTAAGPVRVPVEPAAAPPVGAVVGVAVDAGRVVVLPA